MLAVVAVLAVGAIGCDEDDQPGSPAVYERIESLTDCVELQAEFDTAAANNDRAAAGSEEFDVTLSYMEAADDRLAEVGCYE